MSILSVAKLKQLDAVVKRVAAIDYQIKALGDPTQEWGYGFRKVIGMNRLTLLTDEKLAQVAVAGIVNHLLEERLALFHEYGAEVELPEA